MGSIIPFKNWVLGKITRFDEFMISDQTTYYHVIGGLSALGSAFCWALAAIMFRKVATDVSATGLNLTCAPAARRAQHPAAGGRGEPCRQIWLLWPQRYDATTIYIINKQLGTSNKNTTAAVRTPTQRIRHLTPLWGFRHDHLHLLLCVTYAQRLLRCTLHMVSGLF